MPDPQDIRDDYEERAAIKQFCAGMSRARAETEALAETRAKYGEWKP